MSAESDKLRTAAIATREAAWREGIEPNGPLGVWVTAQVNCLHAQSDMVEMHEATLAVVMVKAKEVIDKQVVALNKAHDAAIDQGKLAEIAIRKGAVDQELLVNQTVGELTARVSERLNNALVIRQRRYDRNDRLGSGAMLTAIAFVLFFGGYALHSYMWWYEMGAVERCVREAVASPDNKLFCPVSAVKSGF